jgi:hypothetical protein
MTRLHDPLGVVVVLERHHKVIGKPHQSTRSRHAGSHLGLEPLIQHMVQENVCEQRRDDAALRGAFGRQPQGAIFQDPCVEPLADHPSDYAVGHSLVEDGPKFRVRNRSEILAYVNFDYPVLPLPRDDAEQFTQRLMRRSSGPEAVRARQEILLVDRLQDHGDRAARAILSSKVGMPSGLREPSALGM